MTDRPPEPPDSIEIIAAALAKSSMDGIGDLLPPDDAAALEELIAMTLAHQPRLRIAMRRIAPDPSVASSGEVARDGDDAPVEHRDVAKRK